MLKRIPYVCLFLAFLFLTACSSEPPLKLVDTHVGFAENQQLDEVVEDKELHSAAQGTTVTPGDREAEEPAPKSLYYEFTLENTGDKTIDHEDITISMEPDDGLKSLSEDIAGVNIYDTDDSEQGYGRFKQDIESGEDGTYMLSYDIEEEDETLNELKENALGAELHIEYENRNEVTFDLDE